MQDANGNFLFTSEQLASTVLRAGEKPYAKERPGRFAAILRARMDVDMKFRKEQIEADKLSYREAENNTLKYIVWVIYLICRKYYSNGLGLDEK